ncbi:multiple coagulation factor deficiency protein 2 homolog [Exaiptasia diaphana]|uniref:EF-hand domain-containing protein n=1 Tax=Exaiptasia diaphana TaxID=2652724 RepID=A0A913X1R6_EXADI|nr:multiple coagulation factor deficiency protein 2 homolog [Exaiptasia diaphana]KXJ16017.1 Multiple coagulation factor deficiency protein 2-like [Exaiptasia diaphana]
MFYKFLEIFSVKNSLVGFLLFTIHLSQIKCETNSTVAEENLRSQVKDTNHLVEHLQDHFGLDEKAAREYLKNNDENAQYFLMHDNNNDSKLDGLEILSSLSHHRHQEDEKHDKEDSHNSEESLVEFVDMILSDQDLNKDGFITYPEFITFMSKHQQNNAKNTEPAKTS